MSRAKSVDASRVRQFAALDPLLTIEKRQKLHHLLERAGLTRDDGSYRFSELTLKYPRMQFAPFDVSEECLDEISIGHLAFILYGFLYDRQLDGQVSFTENDVQLVEEIKLAGIEHVWRASLAVHASSQSEKEPQRTRDYDRFQQRINGLLADYRDAQLTPYLDGSVSTLTPRREMNVAAGRAGYGFIATSFFSERLGISPKRRRAMKNAYDSLVTALQWADDMVDWQEDLITGDENLLLVSLKETGLDSYAHPPNAVREANVGHALIENGLIDKALKRTHFWLRMAQESQRRLGCDDLFQRIADNNGAVDQAATTVESDIRRMVHATVMTFSR